MKKLFFCVTFSLLFVVFTQQTYAADIITTGKLITVDIGKQMLYAWDGGKIVYQTPISTGMRYTPTVRGSFKIYKKLSIQDMKGYYPPYEPYYLKNVPNVMYFYQAYAIHGAFWHNRFGSRVTHGCVNVPVAQSKWLFDWAPDGTRVEIF